MTLETAMYDPNQPQGALSAANLRNSLRGIWQGDLAQLRPAADLPIDEFEYGSAASAQAQWSGTGVTVTVSTTKQEGSYSLQCVIDGTGNRKVSKTETLDLSPWEKLRAWNRCDATSSAIQLYLRDSSGNESYWDITTNGTADIWQQETITLASPDSNNGTDADLSDITEWGYLGLDASATYLFDIVKAVVGLNVVVNGYDASTYHQNVYLTQDAPLTFVTKASPTITPPVTNPRIDVLTVDASGVLAWTTGTEASTPAMPAIPAGKLPICAVYCKTTMAKVVSFPDAAANPNEAYIWRDIRPLWIFKSSSKIQDGDGDTSVDCEETPAINKVRVKTGGTQRAQFDGDGLTLQSGVAINEFSTDGTLSGNSDTAVPTEKAVKSAIEGAVVLPEHYLTGFEFVYDTALNFKVSPGVIELQGGLQKSVADKTITDITSAENYFEGSPVSGEDWVYVYARANSTDVEIKLSLTPPDLADTAENTAGILRYRKVSSVFYRCLFAIPTDGSGNIRRFTQDGSYCQYASFRLLSNSSGVSAFNPAISNRAYFHCNAHGNGQKASLRPVGYGDYQGAFCGGVEQVAVVECQCITINQQVDTSMTNTPDSYIKTMGWWINTR